MRQVSKNAIFVASFCIKNVAAYKDFLRSQGCKINKVESSDDFLSLPVSNKKNYVSKYKYTELTSSGSGDRPIHISASSGSSGMPFYWPRTDKQDEVSAKYFDRIYMDAFRTNSKKTLVVNTFALGSWVAGFEFYNATRKHAVREPGITIITPGPDIDAAIREVKSLASYFDQIILSGYPPFVRDIIEAGNEQGIDWKKFKTKLLFAGEAVSSQWKDHTQKLIGANDRGSIIGVYGMAECGIIGNETAASIDKFSGDDDLPEGTTSLYEYDENERFLEVDDDNHLLLTTQAGIPLVRYDTMDEGGLLEANKKTMVYLFGRRDSAVTIYGVNIFADTIKSAIHRLPNMSEVSGKFVMQGATHNDKQKLKIFCELAKDTSPSNKLSEALTELIVSELKLTSSEYKKLSAMIGDKAVPEIILKNYGDIGYKPGKKHKWVKKD